MRLNIIEEGKRAWYDGCGFISNPYHVWHQEEEYMSWSKGWWCVQDEMEAKDRKQLQEEFEREAILEAKAQEIKEKKKTKKGRAELGGQATMF